MNMERKSAKYGWEFETTLSWQDVLVHTAIVVGGYKDLMRRLQMEAPLYIEEGDTHGVKINLVNLGGWWSMASFFVMYTEEDGKRLVSLTLVEVTTERLVIFGFIPITPSITLGMSDYKVFSARLRRALDPNAKKAKSTLGSTLPPLPTIQSAPPAPSASAAPAAPAAASSAAVPPPPPFAQPVPLPPPPPAPAPMGQPMPYTPAEGMPPASMGQPAPYYVPAEGMPPASMGEPAPYYAPAETAPPVPMGQPAPYYAPADPGAFDPNAVNPGPVDPTPIVPNAPAPGTPLPPYQG